MIVDRLTVHARLPMFIAGAKLGNVAFVDAVLLIAEVDEWRDAGEHPPARPISAVTSMNA